MCSLLLIFIYISLIYAELILYDGTTWRDDFSYDPLGETGWKIQQISGYSLPTNNPMVIISKEPKYHGPFPSSYLMERYLTCNTKHNTRLFISFLTSYCNTDKKNDNLLFTITDTTNTSILPIFAQNKLNNKNKLLKESDLAFIRNATTNYYANHSPNMSYAQCTCCSAREWYTSNIYNTYQLTIIGANKHKIIINILTSDDRDEYVVISDIAMLCIQIPMATHTNTRYATETGTETHTTNPAISSSEIIDREHDGIVSTTNSTVMIEVNLGVINGMKPMDILWYMLCILFMIICCGLGVFIACFVSIKKQLNGLQSVNGVKAKDDKGYNDKVVAFMMNVIRTDLDDECNSNSEMELIRPHTGNINSNAVSVEEGNPDYCEDKIDNQERDMKLNDDACSCSDIGSEHSPLQIINDVFVSHTK